MTLLLVVVAIGIVAGVAVLVARDKPLIADDPVSASRLAWPPPGELVAEDLDRARFTVALRGYRMDEVDRVLADMQDALADRDRRIAALELRARSEPPAAAPAQPDARSEPALADPAPTAAEAASAPTGADGAPPAPTAADGAPPDPTGPPAPGAPA